MLKTSDELSASATRESFDLLTPHLHSAGRFKKNTRVCLAVIVASACVTAAQP